MDKRLILLLLAVVGSVVLAGCGSTEVPKGDDKPPSGRPDVKPPSDKR